MAAVVEVFQDVYEAVVEPIVEVVQDVGRTVDREIVKPIVREVVAPIAETVEKVVDAAMEDPLGTIAKVTTAIVAPALLPLVSGAVTLAHGGSMEDAFKSAATTYVAQGVSQYVSNVVNPLADQAAASAVYATDIGSQQTAMLAAQETGMGTLTDTVGNVAGKIAGGTAAGVIRGQDALTALENSGISAGTGAVLTQIPGFEDLSPAAQGAVRATVSASLMGGDPSEALINSAINAGIRETANYIDSSSWLGSGATGNIEHVFDPTYGGTLAPVGVVESISDMTSAGNALSGTVSDDIANYYGDFINPSSGPNVVNSGDALQTIDAPLNGFIDPNTEHVFDPTYGGTLPVVEPPIDAPLSGYLKDPNAPITAEDLQNEYYASIGIDPKSLTDTPAMSTEEINNFFQDAGTTEPGLTSLTPATPDFPIDPTAGTPLYSQGLSDYEKEYYEMIGIDPESMSDAPPMTTSEMEEFYKQSGISGNDAVVNSTPYSFNPSGGFNISTSGGSKSGSGTKSDPLTDYIKYGGAALATAGLLNYNKDDVQDPYKQYLQMLNWNAKNVIGPYDGVAFGQEQLKPEFTSVAAASGGMMRAAQGGIASLGGYSNGGRLLKGPGDGMSDHIPAMIGNNQPARLADGEFVIPADVVSHLGNGSTDAGAKALYTMMDRIRKARTGTKKQGTQINPNKFMPR